MSEQTALLKSVLSWLIQNNYRRASFERLIGTVVGCSTYSQLHQLVACHPQIFRSADMRGSLPGLALLDNVNPRTAIPNDPITVGEPLTLPGFPEPIATPKTFSVTLDDVNAEIVSEHYINAGEAIHASDLQAGRPTQVLPQSLALLTICILTLRNGFTVTGKSACVDPALYNREKGQELARKQAVEHIWPFLGFRLADRLNQDRVTGPAVADTLENAPVVQEREVIQPYAGILRNSPMPYGNPDLPHHSV
jgi:hypothetical protein